MINNTTLFIVNLPALFFIVGSVILAINGVSYWWLLSLFGILIASSVERSKKD